MPLSLIHPGYVMTDYRTFRAGVDDFYNTTSQNLMASVAYRHTRKGLFANALVIHSWRQLPYTISQWLLGDYVVDSYADARNDGKMLTANGTVGKTLDFMRGTASINGSFSRNGSHLLSEGRSVDNVSTSWSVGGKLNGTPVHWLSLDYSMDFSSSRLTMNREKSGWLGSLENKLLVNLMPGTKWEWRVSGEHYRNELMPGMHKSVFMLDTKLVYKATKRIELSAMLCNILNERTYRYTTYSQLTSFESQRPLRGRELLLSLSLRK